MATITVINLAATCDIPYLNSVVPSGGNPLTTLGFTMQNTSPVGIEYEVSTDSSFTNIILTGVITTINTPAGGGYSIDIPFDATPYVPYTTYVRIRKHCTNTNISAWSIPLTITTGSSSWGSGVGVAPYEFNPVVAIPGNYPTPVLNKPQESDNYNICMTGNSYTVNVKIDTATPQVGTQIYLNDGITKAIPGNIPSSFGGVTEVTEAFNTSGIRWIRFTSSTPGILGMVWDVEPSTGKIVSLSNYNCIE